MRLIKLVILLLIGFNSFGQLYYVVPTMNNPAAKVQLVSARFYQLSRPDATDSTRLLFGYIIHPINDSVAIEIDSNLVVPKGNITATQVTNFITETYGTLTTTQRNQITNYVNNNTLLKIGRLIITSRLKLWTKQELEARGWFNIQLL